MNDTREAPDIKKFRTSLDLNGKKGALHPDLEGEIRDHSRHTLDTSMKQYNNLRLSQTSGTRSPKGSERSHYRSDASPTKHGSQYGSQQTREDQLLRDGYDEQNFSFHSMELASHKGSIEAGKEDKTLSRLKKKQKDKM